MSKHIFDKSKLLIFKPTQREKDEENFEKFLAQVPSDYTGNVFRVIRRDSIGNSGGHPTWGEVYQYENGRQINNGRIALYKEYDYDEPVGAYAEKLWSILGKTILDGVRVPDIDIAYREKFKDQPETISYRLLDLSKEEMFLMDSILERYCQSRDLEIKGICTIEELLKGVKDYVKDEENYKELEEKIIFTIILDSISNNGDRHYFNWGIVRNKITNKFELALFDHTNGFRNIIIEATGMAQGNWASSYFKIDPEYRKHNTAMGDMANNILIYIQKKYPEYFNKFIDILDERIPVFEKSIEDEKVLKERLKNVKKTLHTRKRFLKTISGRGEIYEQ